MNFKDWLPDWVFDTGLVTRPRNKMFDMAMMLAVGYGAYLVLKGSK